MEDSKKFDVALKIYEHALALDGSHPDMLNAYGIFYCYKNFKYLKWSEIENHILYVVGEFLERNKKDVLLAEHMYCKALIISPHHTKALSNRARTLPLVEEIDQSSFNRIDQKRETLVQVPDTHPALRRMKQESYYRHIHHTTAIEGNTFSLMETRSFVETRMVVAGKSIIEHNEILGMDAAYHYVNSTLVHRIGSITIDDILNIHKHVLGFVDPIGAGQFRTAQVFVGDHTPPAATDIVRLMNEFIEWLNSNDALSLHPIELAALAHYHLVYIHPFYDGNGRSSRLLMNLILMQAGYPPIIIQKEERLKYYEYLQTANDGDVRPFIRFIARCTERTLDEYLWVTSEKPNNFPPSMFVPEKPRVITVGDEDYDFESADSRTNSEYKKPYL